MKPLAFVLLLPFVFHASAADLPSSQVLPRVLQTADKDKNGTLSLAEYLPLDVQAKHHGEEHFKAGDANNDGSLDVAEIITTLRKQTWFAILTEGAQGCFAGLDLNKDSKLDATEYRKISRMGHHSDQHFNGADSDKDGLLSLAEFTVHAEHQIKALENTSPKNTTSR